MTGTTMLGRSGLFTPTVMRIVASATESVGLPRYELEADFSYSSVQFDLPAEVARTILEWNFRFIPDDALFIDDDTPGREQEPHITVKYGLVTNDPGEVREVLDGVAAFPVEFGRVSAFRTEDKPFDVLKLSVHSPQLRAVHYLLGDLLENHDQHPVYAPHLTLAYVKKGWGEELEGARPFGGLTLWVGELTFSSRGGNKVRFPLDGVESDG